MHRLGMDTPEELLRAAAYPQLAVEGIFTHFAVADGGPGDRVSQAYTEHQFEKFLALAGAVERGGVPLKLRHCCNSAAGMRYEAMRLDMVRPGIILYGQKPSPDCPDLPELRPVMELKSTVAQVRELREGETVGYGRHYTAPKSRRVATVTAGYADGFLRGNAGGEVLICGRRAPILGTICMDQLMADVTEIPEAAPGCTATLFGRDGGLFLDAEEVAARMNTISYEVLSGVGRRVPRFYRKDGAQSGSANDFLAEDLAESSGTLGE